MLTGSSDQKTGSSGSSYGVPNYFFPFIAKMPASDKELLLHQIVIASVLSSIVYEQNLLQLQRHLHHNPWIVPYIRKYQSSVLSHKAESWHLEMLFSEYINPSIEQENEQDAIIVAFKGSRDLNDWLSNSYINMVECIELSPSHVHKGFLELVQRFIPWKSIGRAVLSSTKSKRLILAGHSRGGAIAMLVALLILSTPEFKDVDLYCVTFGSPLIGNIHLSSIVHLHQAHNRFVSFINARDPVPFILASMPNSNYFPCGMLVVIREKSWNINPLLDLEEESLDNLIANNKRRMSLATSLQLDGGESKLDDYGLIFEEITMQKFFELTKYQFDWLAKNGVSKEQKQAVYESIGKNMNQLGVSNSVKMNSSTRLEESSHSHEKKQNPIVENVDSSSLMEASKNYSSTRDGNLISNFRSMRSIANNIITVLQTVASNALNYHVMDNYTSLFTTHVIQSKILKPMLSKQRENPMMIPPKVYENILMEPVIQKVDSIFSNTEGIRVIIHGQNVDCLTMAVIKMFVFDTHWNDYKQIEMNSDYQTALVRTDYDLQEHIQQNDSNRTQKIEFVFKPLPYQYLLKNRLIRLTVGNLFYEISYETNLQLRNVLIVSKSSQFELVNPYIKAIQEQLGSSVVDKVVSLPVRGFSLHDEEIFLQEKVLQVVGSTIPNLCLCFVNMEDNLQNCDKNLIVSSIVDPLHGFHCHTWFIFYSSNEKLELLPKHKVQIQSFVKGVSRTVSILRRHHVKFVMLSKTKLIKKPKDEMSTSTTPKTPISTLMFKSWQSDLFESSAARETIKDDAIQESSNFFQEIIYRVDESELLEMIHKFFLHKKKLYQPTYIPNSLPQLIMQMIEPYKNVIKWIIYLLIGMGISLFALLYYLK